MKHLRYLFLALGLLLSLGSFADTPPVIPQNLLSLHIQACPEFGSVYGQYFTRGVYPLPKSPYSSEVKTLYVLGCEMYAYNSLERAYILNAKGEITPVYVADIDFERSLTATADLMGADYDEASRTLGTFQKGRGIGDCGSATTYLYNPESEKFIMIEARLKNACDGDMESEWPVIYSKETK